MYTIGTEFYDIKTMSWDDERGKGYYHNPLLLAYNGHETIIGSGQSDMISLFSHNDDIILLSVNASLGYAGLTVYDHNLKEKYNIFDQNPNDQLSGLYQENNDFFDQSYKEMAIALYDLASELNY